MDEQTQIQLIDQRRSPRWWRMISVVSVALILGVLMRATLLLAAPSAAPVATSLAQNAPHHDGDDDEIVLTYGIIITRPEENPGTWVISNTTATSYTVTDGTDTEGDLAVGTCVEVKSLQSNPTLALKIRPKDAHKCNNDNDDHDDYIIHVGFVVTRPDEKVGTWVISGTTVTSYSVTEGTDTEGNLALGRCVEVKSLESNPTLALKVREKDAFHCGGDPDKHDDDHHDDLVRYGRLSERPDGKVGTWVIGGVAYTATESTELDQEHGWLKSDVCTKVEVREDSPTVAKEIESAKDYKCDGRDGDDNARATLYGVIEQLPPEVQNGDWVIGGLTFGVSSTTELVSKGETFTVGLTVKVDFSTNLSDTHFARRIEIKFGQDNPCRHHFNAEHASNDPNHNGDDDDDGDDRRYGDCPGHEGKTFGRINERSKASLIGEWMIGGVPYMTTASTRFHADDDFLEGERVKVEYVVLSDNMRWITKIKEIDGDGGNPNASLIVGYVDAKPEAFVGSWEINGAPFEAVSTTIFIEHGTLFAIGAYVVVDYEIVDNRRLMHKILTYVPPGAGDDHRVGNLESMGGVVAAGLNVPSQNNETWTVDGVNYIVSEATQLVDSGEEFAPGVVVSVNSYTVDGQRYATLIRAQGATAFIPMAVR